MLSLDLTIPVLRRAYRTGSTTPADVMTRLLERIDGDDEHHVWVTRLTRSELEPYLAALAGRSLDDLPLYGIPFVIKDNIDLVGCPTTAGCPQFAYVPERSATVVQRLLEAGAIPLGKTNLDQFATGLVGTRSPYGACRNGIDGAYVSGGSSAGSAVAVARGLASFSLGTDTAGSGRVPAAFNNIIGLKPSAGRLSTRGVVPACRSLDCVSVFALTAEDAGRVLEAAEGFDVADPFSRVVGERALPAQRFGVPRREQLQFFGDADYERLFGAALEALEAQGGVPVEIDFSPFLEAAGLLYRGPWVAERFAAVGDFIEAHPDAVNPVTRQIIMQGREPSAVDLFRAQYRLEALRRACDLLWSSVDFIVTPTAGTIYRIDAVAAEPVALNANLGYYTNSMNLLELAGIAVPAGFRRDGLPFGITLVGPHGSDRALLALARRYHPALSPVLGAALGPTPDQSEPARRLRGYEAMAVCGAHMQGLPLNHQLRDRGGYLLQRTRSAAQYRLFALPGGPPHRPGLLRVAENGAAIELEVWALPAEHVGSFVAAIPAPLVIGKVELEDGSRVPGFLCESVATTGALDITAHGGWRAYRESVPA